MEGSAGSDGFLSGRAGGMLGSSGMLADSLELEDELLATELEELGREPVLFLCMGPL